MIKDIPWIIFNFYRWRGCSWPLFFQSIIILKNISVEMQSFKLQYLPSQRMICTVHQLWPLLISSNMISYSLFLWCQEHCLSWNIYDLKWRKYFMIYKEIFLDLKWKKYFRIYEEIFLDLKWKKYFMIYEEIFLDLKWRKYFMIYEENISRFMKKICHDLKWRKNFHESYLQRDTKMKYPRIANKSNPNKTTNVIIKAK